MFTRGLQVLPQSSLPVVCHAPQREVEHGRRLGRRKPQSPCQPLDRVLAIHCAEHGLNDFVPSSPPGKLPLEKLDPVPREALRRQRFMVRRRIAGLERERKGQRAGGFAEARLDVYVPWTRWSSLEFDEVDRVYSLPWSS